MGLFTKKTKQTIGYKYYLGMHMIAGHGNLDGLEKIKVGEKIAWTTSSELKQSITDLYTSIGANPQTWLAQTFTAINNYTLTSIDLRVFRSPTQFPGRITISVRNVDIDGHPTGNDLCKGYIEENELVATLNSSNSEWETAILDTPIFLTSGIKYAIIIRGTESGGYDSLTWCADSNNYSEGNAEISTDCGKTWIIHPSDIDFNFKTYQKQGTPPNNTININNPNLFGGVEKEGGIEGNVDLMFGDIAQSQNSYLVSLLGSDIPAFRGLFSAILRRVYVGSSPYIKPWSFFLKRVCKQTNGDDQWYKEKAVINPQEDDGDDLNAIHIIRECLINSEWGLGELEDDIDDNSFKEAANICYDENFGLSILWDQNSSIEEFVGEILNCIAGILYQDLETGKWVISLTRDPNYDNPYDYNNTGDDTHGSREGSIQQFAQTFTTSKNYSCNKIKIKIFESAGEFVSNIKVEIQDTDVDGYPNGNILASGIISGNDVSTEAAWVECNLTSNVNLITNTKYALVIYPLGIKIFYWRVNTHSSFLGGNYIVSNDGGSTWTFVYTNDFMFEIYAGGDLETFNEDDIINIEDFDRPTYGEVIDKVEVSWWDKINHKPRIAPGRDIALIEKQGGAIIEQSYNYPGICNATLANQIVERELKLAASMLASMKIVATRKMAHLKPNDVFILSWSDLDITSMIIRVLNVNYGSLNKNEIILDCIEDVFSTAYTIYGDPPDTLWTDIVSDAVDVTNYKIIEIPYYTLCKDLLGSISLVDTLDVDSGFIYVLPETPSDDSFDYNLLVRLSALFDFEDLETEYYAFTPTAIINSNLLINANDIIINLSSEIDLDLVEENSYAILDDEIVAILSIDKDNMQIEIARGVLDTVPAAHFVGDKIYFAETKFGVIDKEYTATNTPQIKFLPRTANGVLNEDDATIRTASALNSRAYRPYPPGNLKFNAERYPWTINTTVHSNKIAITWSNRNRKHTTQLNSLIKQIDTTDFGREDGIATYTIKIYDKNNILGRTVSGLTGTSYDYTETFEIADFGSLQDRLKFVIYTVRDGYDSWQSHEVILDRVKGTSSAISNIVGSLNIQPGLKSSINGISNIIGIINNSILFYGNSNEVVSLIGDIIGCHIKNRGIINGISNIFGNINLELELKGNLNSYTNLYGIFTLNIKGEIISASNISGFLNSQLKYKSDSTGISEVTGSLTVIEESVLQDHYNINDDSASEDVGAGIYDTHWEGQTFTANQDYTIKSTKIRLFATLSAAGKTVTISIRATSGGKPTGEDLCSGTINGGLLGLAIENADWFEADFGDGVLLSNGIQYAICARSDETGNNIYMTYDNSSPTYIGGNKVYSNDTGENWSSHGGYDMLFETYGH